MTNALQNRNTAFHDACALRGFSAVTCKVSCVRTRRYISRVVEIISQLLRIVVIGLGSPCAYCGRVAKMSLTATNAVTGEMILARWRHRLRSAETVLSGALIP